MESYIAYFDETGDDGVTTESSDQFILTSVYLPMSKWQENFDIMKSLRNTLKKKYGFHVSQEMHTRHFVRDKGLYREYNWTNEDKCKIINMFAKAITMMDLSIINVIIDKTKFKDDNYKVLENALKYNIQRIDNDSNRQWNYIIITDKGRVSPMRKTARAIRAYNPIQSKFSYTYSNQPVMGLIEDILEKDSSESYFIQICDFVSYFVYLYFSSEIKGKPLPKRVASLIDQKFVCKIMDKLKEAGKFNLKAASSNQYGLVIYPK